MAGSAYGTTGGGGSAYGSSGASTIFTDLRQTIQTQADALVAPADTPSVDTMRLVTDGTNRALWTYDVSEASWKGVQVA